MDASFCFYIENMHLFIYLQHLILFLNVTYSMFLFDFFSVMCAVCGVLKMVNLQSKHNTQEDFFEINILRVKKKGELSCVFVVISQLSDQSISQRASCL